MIQRRKIERKEPWIPGAIPFFLFGFIYYLVSPFFVFRILSVDNDLLSTATKYSDLRFFDILYFLDAIFVLTSFLLGYNLGRLGTKSKSTVLDYGSCQKDFPLLLAIAFLMLIAYFAVIASASGSGFFTGYSSYNVLVLGPFSTCAFVSAWFVNYFSRKQISLLFWCFFTICSVLLLGWGSRMFFVLGFVALILGLISKNRSLLKSLWFYVFVGTSCLFMVMVGILREGGSEFSSDNLIAVFFAEPLFTSISGSLYLESAGGRPVYAIPVDLFAAIIHFIPSAVFPGKIELISEITFNEHVESPFGAKALLVSMYSNFGMFYPIFIAIIGYYYGLLYTKARYSVFYRATYFSALPILLFLFYREGLVTVIKVMFFNGLIVPLFISLLLIGLSSRTRVEKRIANTDSRSGTDSGLRNSVIAITKSRES